MNDIAEKLKAGLPPAALRFTAGTSATGVKAEGEKGIKVHLKARGKAPIEHWCFGKVAHDFSTFSMPSKVALDDSHGTEVGHGRPILTAWGLEIDGLVIPNEQNEQHDSNRIAYNLANGIPQQASIDFSGDYDVLCVPEGMTYPVNGQTLEGPACVIQNWTLRSCAICKEGADPNTETTAQFSGDKAPAKPPRNVTTLSKDFYFPANNEATELQNKDKQTMGNEAGKTTAETEAAKAEELKAQQDAAAKLEADKKAEDSKLKAEADEAAKLQAQQLTAKDAKITELTAKVAELETKLSAVSTGTKPLKTEAQGNGGEKSLWQQYAEIKDPAEKTKFYQAHKAQMKN